ncbi:MAG: VWA domain-containing protein [Candidatus Omnitrophota bacterium]
MLTIIRSKKGVSLLWMAVIASVLAATGAFAVDLGRLWLARNELQNVADAAALAGASALGSTHNEVRARARDVACENSAGGESIQLNAAEIEPGNWDADTKAFTPLDILSGTGGNAVRVTASRTCDSNGPIGLCFGRLLGEDQVELTACAIAVGEPSADSTTGNAPQSVNTTTTSGNSGLSQMMMMDPFAMFVFDTSDSMVSNKEDCRELSQKMLTWADCFLADITTKVGLVEFGSEAELKQGLNANYGEISRSIEKVKFGSGAEEETHNIAGALEAALSELEANKEDVPIRTVFLFSDGQYSAEEQSAALAQAERAAKLGYPIYSFGVGKDVSTDNLEKIAEASDGRYYTEEDALAMCTESINNYQVWLVR